MISRDPAIDLDIIRLLSDGYSTKEIAYITKYQVSTIDTYRYRIIRAYGCKNTAHLIAHCFNIGILKLKPLNGNETKDNENYKIRQARLLREHDVCY